MRSEEFIAKISQAVAEKENLETLRKGIPLGVDAQGNVVLAKKRACAYNQVCVTGVKRSAFICRTLLTLSCLYDKDEAQFLILSPREEYAELLRLRNMDVTVPYLRSVADLESVKNTVKELLMMRENGSGYPRLCLVLDGLEELTEVDGSYNFEEYREFYNLVMRKEEVEIISGLNLARSIFVGYPGALVGIGNCLVSMNGEGKADVTYVNDDVSLSQPVPITFPNTPSLMESILFLNALPKE